MALDAGLVLPSAFAIFRGLATVLDDVGEVVGPPVGRSLGYVKALGDIDHRGIINLLAG